MRLIRLKAPAGLDNLQYIEEDRPIPTPGPGELVVRIRACSLNFHDDLVVLGQFQCADGRVPMSDGAGEVISVGEQVRDFKVGDNVVSRFFPDWLDGEAIADARRNIPGETIDGYAREYVCMPAHAFTQAPAGYTHVEAATLPCAALAAWRGLVVCGRVKPGDIVLTQGTGAVSLFALQFAKAAGAQVIATSSSDGKLDRLRRMGADTVVNYKAVPDWGQKVKDLTDGRGVDHVMEVGGPGTFMQSIAACRLGGHIAVIGVLTGFAGELVIPALFGNMIRTSGISVGNRADQESMIRAISATRIRPVIDRTFPLREAGAAFRYFESKQYFGKVCLEL
jgi:NADPH:quinone reductase-like Zn-dependent oxidoreductase